jgi:hypothetical protein
MVHWWVLVHCSFTLAIAIGRTGGEVGGCELGVTNCPYLTKRKMEGLGGRVWLVMKEGGVCASIITSSSSIHYSW